MTAEELPQQPTVMGVALHADGCPELWFSCDTVAVGSALQVHVRGNYRESITLPMAEIAPDQMAAAVRAALYLVDEWLAGKR